MFHFHNNPHLKKSLYLFALVFLAFFVSCNKDNDPVPAPSDGNIKFMVLADLHYMHPDILVSEGQAFDQYNAEECKLLRESGALLDAAIEKIKAVHPHFVIICGDMTKDGELICHQHVADAFKKLENETGTKVLVVPGNHDLDNPHALFYDGDRTTPASGTNETQFAAIYADLGFDHVVQRRDGSLDYMAYPVDGIAFIGVNSNEKNTPEELLAQGGLSRIQTQWITQMAQMAHADGRYVIMAMHHNLVDFYDHAQLVRGSDIANARYEDYDNRALIDDLCAAGIDVVFSGHSHMHSITRAHSANRSIYSVVTSSLVNLPLSFRTAVVDKNGLMSLTTGDVKDCRIPGGGDLISEGERYWRDLAAFYMREAADKAWEAAAPVLQEALNFEDKEALLTFLKNHVEDVFATFLFRTSDGNEHLYTPETNYQAADAALQGIMDYFDQQGVTDDLDIALGLIFNSSLEEVHQMFREFFHSAYFNYLGSDPMMLDDVATIQLHK